MVDARHQLRLPSRLVQRLRALVPDLPWTTGNLYMEEAIQIPSVDCRLKNESPLLQVRGLLLKHQGPRLVSNPPPPPPAITTLQVVLFLDGYDPRGRSNYNVKVAILVSAVGCAAGSACGNSPPFWHTLWVEVTIRHSLGVQICCVLCLFVVETRCTVAQVLKLR